MTIKIKGEIMAIFKINKTQDYTVMSNYHLRDKNLSLKAKGLLSLMFSLPDDWDYSISGLEKILKEGRDSIMTALQELEEFKYLKRESFRNDKGQYECTYNIYELPQIEENSQEKIKEETNTEKPSGENRVGLSDSENPTQINTKNKITKTNNKENIIKEIVDYLNEKMGTKYRASTKSTASCINARLKEGYKVENFKTVIDKKYKEWKGTEMEKYLTPDTLFRPSKFEKYLNQNIVKENKSGMITREYTKAQTDALYDNLDDVEV